MRTQANVPTAHAHRYMVQLCKHFGHRIETSFDDHDGRIRFDAGEVRLQAGADALAIAAEAAAPEGLDRLEEVIGSHLKRFAFREPDLAVDWTRAA